MARIVIQTASGETVDTIDVDPFTWRHHVPTPQTNVDARDAVNRIGRALGDADEIEEHGHVIERPSEKAMRRAAEKLAAQEE